MTLEKNAFPLDVSLSLLLRMLLTLKPVMNMQTYSRMGRNLGFGVRKMLGCERLCHPSNSCVEILMSNIVGLEVGAFGKSSGYEWSPQQ